MSKHIVISAGTAHASAADLSVTVEGSPAWTRIQWLNADLKSAAIQCAQLCRELDIEPVIRVGGSANGYTSLKNNSGITDAPAPIKNFPWDVFGPMVKKAFDTREELPEEHTFGDEPDEVVEEEAIQGDDEALTKVIGVAASDDDADAGKAKAILAKVPVEELEEWNQAHQAGAK
jgi:hypothetical protein